MKMLFDWLRRQGHTGILVRWPNGMLEAIGTGNWREYGRPANNNEAKS